MQNRIGIVVGLAFLAVSALAGCEQKTEAPASGAAKTSEGPSEATRLGPPGNGVVLCPGNKSCPDETLQARFGIALARENAAIDTDRTPRRMVCPRDPSCPEAPKGMVYVGYLVAIEGAKTTLNGKEDYTFHGRSDVLLCRPGSPKPGCVEETWSFTCQDTDKVCPVWPELPPPAPAQ